MRLLDLSAEKLLEQVAVGEWIFDPVEARVLGTLGGVRVVADDTGDFVRLERARRHERLEAVFGVGLAFGTNGGRGDGKRTAWLQVWVRDAADMPELQEDAAALVVNGLRRELPARNLLRGPDAGRGAIQPFPCALMFVASVTIRPAVARWV